MVFRAETGHIDRRCSLPFPRGSHWLLHTVLNAFDARSKPMRNPPTPANSSTTFSGSMDGAKLSPGIPPIKWPRIAL